MTIRKRLAGSNIAMLVIPLLTAAVLALLGLGAALLLLRGNLMTLHDAAEQIESVLHGFKLTLCVYAAVAALLLAAVALTNLYLTRSLFRHIAQPLDTLTAGVAHIRDGDLDTPIAYGEPDEFKSACDAVDEMATRLKASLEQQAAQQQKQELIVGMSHDLKSPLTAIRAYTEGLLEGVAQDEATRQRYLQTTYAKEADMETGCLPLPRWTSANIPSVWSRWRSVQSWRPSPRSRRTWRSRWMCLKSRCRRIVSCCGASP